MRPRRRPVLVVAIALALVLVLAPEAIAAAGGGSSGFGGGGGGGGGGGRGAALYIIIQILIRVALLGHGVGAAVLVGLLIVWVLFTRVFPQGVSFWRAQESSGRAARRRTAKRERRVALAAAEAAEEDPAFSPEVVRSTAAKLFEEIQVAWDRDDRSRLEQLVGPNLLAEWGRRLDGLAARGWRNRVQPIDDPRIEYVGLTRRGTPEMDRVTVRIEAKLRDYVEDRYGNHLKRAGRLSEIVRIREFWTLAKGPDGQGWILQSIEQGAEGAHALEEKIVPTPWADDQALRDEALVEGAVSNSVPDDVKIGEVADLQFAGDAKAAALDLCLADGRFAPDVLEVAARRAVDAWAEAVDGDDHALRAMASPQATRELLHPGDPSGSTRLVVRGPRVREIRIGGLNAGAEPPTMTISVEITGRRYVEDRVSTRVVAGNQHRESRFTEDWTLALQDDDRQPWRIVSVGTALAAH